MSSFIRRLSLTALLALLALTLAACQSIPKGLTPAQIAVLNEQGFSLTDEGWELGLSSKLLFNTDVASLNEESRASVNRMAGALVGVGIVGARVDGHTDSTGVEAYNDQLSLRRAQAVADVLLEAGMDGQRLSVRGMGQRVPIAPNSTAAGRSENRRVAVVIATE